MKKLILVLGLFFSFAGFAQQKDEVDVLSGARALHLAVFRDKDSASLQKLFSDKLSYGHSGGKLETKTEAIRNISRNMSVYEDLAMSPVSVWIEGQTAIARYQMSANEKTIDGKLNPLKLYILLVWVKEKNDWKVIARQAVKGN